MKHETTGLDPAKDHAIEVAAILYDLEHASVVQAVSSLMWCDRNEAEAINHIPLPALREAPPEGIAWALVETLSRHADVYVAHNADFDRSFVPEHWRRPMPWVCSKNDITWPRQTREGSSLVALALDHGLGVATAHRAMSDCDLIARLFTRAVELGADLQAIMAHAMRPKVEVHALVSYEDRDIAKRAGFQWDGERKKWWRRMALEDTAALPFQVREAKTPAARP